MPSIELNGVSVTIPVYNARGRSIKSSIISASTGGRIAREKGVIAVEALRDVSLQIQSGERVALIGHNGAGKTTLLRVMAGIYEPKVGNVEIRGKVTAMMNSNIGISIEMSGWDNIEMRGVLLGLNGDQIELLKKDVAENSGLGEYLDMPVRTYSAGMRLRLAFCVTTSIKSDILLLDEGIMAGDAEFLKLARSRFDRLLEEANLFVLASHSKHILRAFCDKAIYLKKGSVVCIDELETVFDLYDRSTNPD